LFLKDFGARLARMPVFLPDHMPVDLKDFDTLRWSVRADEKGGGFLFFSNHQPLVPMPDKKDVQFALKTGSGPLLVPRTPVTIPTGTYGIWTIKLDCDGVTLEYATVQPLCHMSAADGSMVYFFTALQGVRPELTVKGGIPKVITPGTATALAAKNAKGKTVSFIVLTPEQGRQLYREPFAGSPHAILSKAAVFADGPSLRLQFDSAADLNLAVFPSVADVKTSGADIKSAKDGIFDRFAFPAIKPEIISVTATLQKPAGPNASSLKGNEEAPWNNAAEYKLSVPTPATGRVLLDIHFIGDAARIYVGDRLFLDSFYNGDPMSVPLWRIPREDWSKLRLKILPYSDALEARLPESAKRKVAEAKAAKALDQVTVTASIRYGCKTTTSSPRPANP
jgi:beta-galactosidase